MCVIDFSFAWNKKKLQRQDFMNNKYCQGIENRVARSMSENNLCE